MHLTVVLSNGEAAGHYLRGSRKHLRKEHIAAADKRWIDEEVWAREANRSFCRSWADGALEMKAFLDLYERPCLSGEPREPMNNIK